VAAQSDNTAEADEMLGAIETLQGALDKLATAATDVRVMVGTASPKMTQSELDNCNIDSSAIETDIRLIPDTLGSVTPGVEFTRTIVVSGGKSPYTAEILEAPVDGFAISQPVPFGPRVQIKGTDSVAAGTYTIFIADAAGHQRSLKLTVPAVQDSAGNGNGSGGGGGSGQPVADETTSTLQNECPEPIRNAPEFNVATPYEERLDRDDARAMCLQRELGLTDGSVDGNIGLETRGAFCRRQKAIGLEPTGRFDEETVNDLVQLWIDEKALPEDDCLTPQVWQSDTNGVN
ncbi:peptidoglycan-binding protein, partial [bacterium]|nr:peptidoglycan-binding protein [bacterium]